VAVRDVVVVGGGPAGLAAATWLARHRRDVVLVDSADYRAAQVDRSHGYLARDPQQPMEFLQTAREQLAGYSTVSLRRGRVVNAARVDGCFRLTLDDDTSYDALRVVLATGVADACPDIEGFADHYGASAFHCPACDGYDAEGRDVIAYGWDEHLVGFATSLLDWARSVVVVTGGRRFAGDESCVRVLDRHGVHLVQTPAPVRMVGRRGELEGLELADGSVVPGSLLFFSVAHEPRTDLARALGCAVDDDGYLVIDETGETTVAGVYAAGDVVPGLQLVQVAAAKGTVAGIAAAMSLRGEPGSPFSPRPAPDGPGEVAQATGGGG
jgi:thioredoxin reductase